MCQRTGRTRSGHPRAANDKRRSRMMTDQMPDIGALVRPGAALREFRVERGLTLAELSPRSGLPVSSLSPLEHETVEVTIYKLLRSRRTEARRGGKECGQTGRSRVAPWP